jgi:hypothetical protein
VSFRGWLAFTLYLGAAVAEATPDQRAALQREVKPLIAELRESNAAAPKILNVVTRVMGPEWHPTGEWEQFISNLIAEEEEE